MDEPSVVNQEEPATEPSPNTTDNSQANATASDDNSILSTSEESTAIDTTSFNVKEEISKIEAKLQSDDSSDIEQFEPSLTSEPIEKDNDDVVAAAESVEPLAVAATAPTTLDVEKEKEPAMQTNTGDDDQAQENATETNNVPTAAEIKADSLEQDVLLEAGAAPGETVPVENAATVDGGKDQAGGEESVEQPSPGNLKRFEIATYITLGPTAFTVTFLNNRETHNYPLLL